jgi:hypothetical protein
MALNHILQVADMVTGRSFAVRLYPGAEALPLGSLFDSYIRKSDINRLVEDSRVAPESAETLLSIQDLVYMSSDDGHLGAMFNGVGFRQGEAPIGLEEQPVFRPLMVADKEVLLAEVEIDRLGVGYDRNWTGFARRRWERRSGEYGAFVVETLRSAYGDERAAEIEQHNSPEWKVDLVRALARRIWESPFESYSRFIGSKIVYKSGDETVRNIMDGGGGICSEKVQALKFLTDHFGIESEYVLAGANVPGPVPEDRLRDLLGTFDFRFARRHMRYWQHTALLYHIDGVPVLVDATNGNVPFLFEEGDSADRLLSYESRTSVPVRMAVHEEDFYYHRVAQDIPENLFFALEGWIPHVDLVQVFDNELGLCITEDYMVTPLVYRAEKTLERLRREYTQVCDRAGLECEVSPTWELETGLGSAFAEAHPEAAAKVMDAREHLLARYDDSQGPGHEAGLVVIQLRDSGAGTD